MNRSEFNEHDNFLLNRQQSQNINTQEANLWHSAHPILNRNDILMNENRRGSDVRSLIQNLMKTKEVKTQNPTTVYTYNKTILRPTLANTEDKIFQEIINLICEINVIKQDIVEEKNKTVALQVERDHKLKKAGRSRSKHMSGDQTYPDHQNLSNSKNKNANELEYESIINKLKTHDLKKPHPESLESQGQRSSQITKNRELYEILQIERQRLANLQKSLSEKRKEIQLANESRIMDEQSNLQIQISKLNKDIDRLKQAHQTSTPNTDYSLMQEIRYLNDQNEHLREKTVRLLTTNHQYSDSSKLDEEISRLQETIAQENKNKELFFEDLKKFKGEFEIIRRQNQKLKGGQYSKKLIPSYERGASYQPVYQKSGEDRFSQYHDLVSEMKNVLK